MQGHRCDRKRKSVSMHQVIQCVTLKVKVKMDVSCIHFSLTVALDDIVTALVPNLVSSHM